MSLQSLKWFFSFKLQTNVPSSPTQPDLDTRGYSIHAGITFKGPNITLCHRNRHLDNAPYSFPTIEGTTGTFQSDVSDWILFDNWYMTKNQEKVLKMLLRASTPKTKVSCPALYKSGSRPLLKRRTENLWQSESRPAYMLFLNRTQRLSHLRKWLDYWIAIKWTESGPLKEI